MIRAMRIVGFVLIAAGVLVLLVWAIEPLRFIWPWLQQLPWPVQLGLGMAAVGLLVLVVSVIWERYEEHATEEGLLDE